MKERFSQGALYRRWNLKGLNLHKIQITKFKERITSEISPAQFPRKSSTVRSASLHKGTNEGAPCIPKQSALLHKGINDGASRIPKRQECALGRWKGSGTHGGQDSTGLDIGLRTSKSSSPSDKPNSRILKRYCGAKEFGNPGPFHVKPKAYAEEEEMSEDERRRSKLPANVAENNPVLDKPRSRKEKAAHHQRQPPKAFQGKVQVQWVSYESMVEEQFKEKLLPPH